MRRKTMTRKVLLAATILMTPWTSEAQTTARLDLDWPAVAGKILERLALEPDSYCHKRAPG